jgi:hypothetical protein
LGELAELVGELRSVGVLLVVVLVAHGLAESSTHGDVVGQVCSQSAVEVGVGGLEMGCEATVLHGQVVVLLLVHLFVDHILLGDTKRSACASLVDLGSTAGGLDSCFETAVTTTRGSNVSSRKVLASSLGESRR